MGNSLLLYFIYFYFINFASAHTKWQGQLCGNNANKTRSCTTQILGNNHNYDTCKVEYFPSNSQECNSMDFGPISSNTNIGGVKLKPYILLVEQKNETSHFAVNYTVLNITFSNIKWKTMKFRFQPTMYKNTRVENHCRNIVISNDVTINDQSVLYYDCYWSLTDGNYNGQNHILDFEATDERSTNRGKYSFKIPSSQMLSESVKEEDWKPFIYVEFLPLTMKLHILPPPKHFSIKSYQIYVMRQSIGSADETVKTFEAKIKNYTEEVTYECDMLRTTGPYYFAVTPLHEKCKEIEALCKVVTSPIISISNKIPANLNICIASFAAVVVSILFAHYVVLKLIRKYFCKDYKLASHNEIPVPPKVLVIYSSANRLHAECVASFVNYLRAEYGFEVLYDGDISITSHGDPLIWADEAFRICTHVLYIVGPAEELNLYHSIYDKPIITAHKDVDILLLNILRAAKTSRIKKKVINIFFEHSNGIVPIETKHDTKISLLKDWHSLISILSKNMLPKRMIMRTEKGKCFIDDLNKANKMLGSFANEVNKPDIKCEKMNSFDKVLL